MPRAASRASRHCASLTARNNHPGYRNPGLVAAKGRRCNRKPPRGAGRHSITPCSAREPNYEQSTFSALFPSCGALNPGTTRIPESTIGCMKAPAFITPFSITFYVERILFVLLRRAKGASPRARAPAIQNHQGACCIVKSGGVIENSFKGYYSRDYGLPTPTDSLRNDGTRSIHSHNFMPKTRFCRASRAYFNDLENVRNAIPP